MTASDQLLDVGLGVLTSERGQFFTFGNVKFWALVGLPLIADRGVPSGLAFGLEYDFEVGVDPKLFKGTLPVAGDTLVSDGQSYRIVGVSNPPGARKITFLVVQPARRAE